MKITDSFQEFVEYSLLEKCLELTTIEWYKRCLKPFLKYLRHNVLPSEVEVINPETLRKYFITLRQRGNTPRTLINNMQGLRSFSNFLLKKKYLLINPFEGIEKPKLSRRLPEFLNEEEARHLLKTCIEMKTCYKSRWYRDISIIALFLFTGIRKRDLLNLKLNDINLEYCVT